MSGGAARPRAGGQRSSAIAGALGFGAWALLSIEAWSGMAYLAGLHGALGRGMWPALCAAWVLLSVLPCALALWALAPALASGRRKPSRQRLGMFALLALCTASLCWSYRAAQLIPGAVAESRLPEPALIEAMRELRDLVPSLPAGGSAFSDAAPVACAAAPDSVPVTLIVRFPASAAGASASPGPGCVQGQSASEVLERLRALLLERAARGPLVLDWVSGVQTLGVRHSWLDALKLRPGLDGACAAQRCLTPGQLLAEGFFSTHRPVSFIPDFQFGVDPERLRAALGAAAAAGLAGLLRIETRSYVLRLEGTDATVTPLLRLRRREVSVTRPHVEQAARAAQGYVLSALLPDGKFRYTLDPLTGAADTESFNLARQAGAVLVLCELGEESAEVRAAIERGLGVFQGYARRRTNLVALTTDPEAELARLGESGLPLASLLFCSMRRGLPLAADVAGLARLVLTLQRPDGGFWPELELSLGKAQPGPEPLYSPGQAVLALVLLEERQRAQPDPALPPLEQLQEALERAMTYVATQYWSHPLAGFFFLEENWHCLAARAALNVHRHAGYEDFCLRYVRFKARLILEREQGADVDFDGGFGFGNLVPPHNTGAAGFGEALAAALAIERARDRDSRAEQQLLKKVLGFLLRQQWSPENCVACASPAVIGGMSEHTHSLLTRIDFAQHAWAALGHGAAVLGASLPAE